MTWYKMINDLTTFTELIKDVVNMSAYVTGFGKTDHIVTFNISRNTVLKH